MCFDPVSMAVIVGTVTALSSAVSQKMSMDAQNAAAVQNYNQQARYAERVNQMAIAQQAETDSRNRLQANQNAATALTNAQQSILQNRVAMSTARASAGTSGMMGLPLNMIEQNYQSLIGGIGTNLQTTYTQLDQGNFFNSMDSKLQAQSITNQAIPNKPYLQHFGMMNALSAGLAGVTGGLGAYNPTAAKPDTSTFSFPNASMGQPTFGNAGISNYGIPRANFNGSGFSGNFNYGSIPRTDFGSASLAF